MSEGPHLWHQQKMATSHVSRASFQALTAMPSPCGHASFPGNREYQFLPGWPGSEFLYGVEMATQLVVKRKISSRLIKNKFFNRTEAAMLSRDGPGDLESLQWAAQTGKETCAVTNRS